jgi:transcriptional antiterminator RfaH
VRLNGDAFCADFRAMPFWSVVRSQSQRERFAAEQLGLRGFETFLPMVQTKRASAPLFNGYFFVRIVEQWRSINYTFGVLCLVRVGDCPARCPDHEVEALQAMVVGGFVRLPEGRGAPVKREMAIGSKVKITSGPFAGMAGLYGGMSTRDRERVLLNLLGGQRSVTIAAGLVVPVQ